MSILTFEASSDRKHWRFKLRSTQQRFVRRG